MLGSAAIRRATCVAGIVLTSTAPLAAQQGGRRETPCSLKKDPTSGLNVLVVSHRDLGAVQGCRLIVRRFDQLLVEIRDANSLIYDYALSAVEIPREAPDARLVAVLGATTPAERVVMAGRTPIELFLDLSDRLARAALRLEPVVVVSEGLDSPQPEPAELTRTVRDSAQAILRDARGSGTVSSLSELWANLAVLREAALTGANAADAARIRARYEEVARFYPAAADLHAQLSALLIGSRFLIWSADAEGEWLVRLAVTQRLPQPYRARRLLTEAGKGINLARIRRHAPWFQSSVGLSWTPTSSRRVHRAEVKDDTTFIASSPRDPLTATPSTVFTVRVPLTENPDWHWGVSAGLGVRIANNSLTLGESFDYSLLATGGFRWLRVSVGATWVSEIDDTTRKPGSHKLSDFDFARRRYLTVAVSYVP